MTVTLPLPHYYHAYLQHYILPYDAVCAFSHICLLLYLGPCSPRLIAYPYLPEKRRLHYVLPATHFPLFASIPHRARYRPSTPPFFLLYAAAHTRASLPCPVDCLAALHTPVPTLLLYKPAEATFLPD